MDNRIRQAENRLFNELGLEVQEHYLDLPSTQLRLRVLVSGRGRLIVLLHGVAQSSAVWAPLLTELRGYQVLAVDLPGHGLSDPVDYTRGQVREHTLRLFDDLLGELGLERPCSLAILWVECTLYGMPQPGPTALRPSSPWGTQLAHSQASGSACHCQS